MPVRYCFEVDILLIFLKLFLYKRYLASLKTWFKMSKNTPISNNRVHLPVGIQKKKKQQIDIEKLDPTIREKFYC